MWKNEPSISNWKEGGVNGHLRQDAGRPSATTNSRFSWTTHASEYDAQSLSDTIPVPLMKGHQPTSRFSWTTRNSELTELFLPDSHQQPKSRFSWTTHNTTITSDFQSHNTTITSDSQSACTPSIPTIEYPELVPRPLSPIITRRRPIPASDVSPAMHRKPTPSLSSKASSNADKDLPLTPSEMASVDIITSLDAQLADLQTRRTNLEKLIASLTQLQPQNPFVLDLAARRENALKVQGFKAELADVTSKEHELGVRLHRAWKKRDQEQPTALWVRRVTG